jgi:hypothetical protein
MTIGSTMTIKDLVKNIRKEIGVNQKKDKWFSRQEMVMIIRKINPSRGKFITSKASVGSFVPTDELFPKFLEKIWIPQNTSNAHPSKENLVALYQAIVGHNATTSDSSLDSIETVVSQNDEAPVEIHETIQQQIENTILDRIKIEPFDIFYSNGRISSIKIR